MEKGETRLIESYLDAISHGDENLIPRTEKLIEKHPEYETRFEKVKTEWLDSGL